MTCESLVPVCSRRPSHTVRKRRASSFRTVSSQIRVGRVFGQDERPGFEMGSPDTYAGSTPLSTGIEYALRPPPPHPPPTPLLPPSQYKPPPKGR